jgi:hypothetical protein
VADEKPPPPPDPAPVRFFVAPASVHHLVKESKVLGWSSPPAGSMRGVQTPDMSEAIPPPPTQKHPSEVLQNMVPLAPATPNGGVIAGNRAFPVSALLLDVGPGARRGEPVGFVNN